MKVLSGLVIAAAMLAISGAARADDFQDDALKASQAATKRDCATVLAITHARLPHPPETAPKLTVSAMWSLQSVCEVEAKDYAQALVSARHAISESNDNAFAPQALLLAGQGANDPDAQVEGIEGLSHFGPSALNRVRFDQMLSIYQGIHDPALKRRVVRALYDGDYYPADGLFMSLDRYWLDMADFAIEDGQADTAGYALARVFSTRGFTLALIDGRLAPVLDRAGDKRTPRAVAESELARWRELAGAHADRLEGPFMVASILERLGRFDEALKALDAAAGPDGVPVKTSYVDYRTAAPKWATFKAYVLSTMGRNDDAYRVLSQAAAPVAGEVTHPLPVVLLAALEDDLGRPKDALATLARFDQPGAVGKLSSSGRNMVDAVRTCAAAQLNDKALVAASLKALTDNESAYPESLTNALVCANDLDGAAASVIRRLNDPLERREALLALCRFLRGPMTPWGALNEQRWDALRDRADVRAAAAKVGRVQSFDLYN